MRRLSATPFRHTLLVSANPATRTLDAVFWAFETDAHAFRLSSEWSGGQFTFVMSNGILVGQEASQAVRLDGGYLLGKPTNLRCRMRVLLTEQDKAKAADEIMERAWASTGGRWITSNGIVTSRFRSS